MMRRFTSADGREQNNGGQTPTRPRWVSRGRVRATIALSLVAAVAGVMSAYTQAASTIWSVRINAGGPAYTDSAGKVWGADTDFVGGTAATTTTAITNTTDQALYQSERWGAFAYKIPVPHSGIYVLHLRMAEIWATRPGVRVYSVTAQGTTVVANLDLVKAIGAATAYDVTVPVRVTTGILDLEFSATANYAKISAIEVDATTSSPAPSATPSPSAEPPTPTGAAISFTTPCAVTPTAVVAGVGATASATLTNGGGTAITLPAIALAGRPPGATNAGGPKSDFMPWANAVTLAPGQQYTIKATQSFANATLGSWRCYVTYETSDGTWHDDSRDTAFTVASGPTPPAPTPSATPLATPTPPPGTTLSGLAWPSGAASGDPAQFAQWRGRPLDYYETWPNRGNWGELQNPDVYGAVSALNGMPGRLQIGLAMIPEDGSASLATCATGAYNHYFTAYANKLVSLNRGNAVVRLGWEANGNWFAWNMNGQEPNWKACFRQEAQTLKAAGPHLLIDFNMNKSGSFNVYAAYPGDDVVDIIGVDFYSMYPGYPTQAAWDSGYMASDSNSPIGIGAWLAFARQHGKKLSVPEWGVNNGSGGGGDDASYIQNMHSFFVNNAASIAYECYFNLQNASFIVDPPGPNPNASAAYRTLF